MLSHSEPTLSKLVASLHLQIQPKTIYMNSLFNLSSLAKSAFTLATLFIISSSALKAQDAVIHNFTSCDMAVAVTGTVSCTSVDCIQNIVVPANSSATLTLSCTAGLNAIKSTITADCLVSSPVLNMNTTYCACAVGTVNDDDSFTYGSWTVYSQQYCTGSDIEIKIWD